jgi:nicotinamidase/pyrazinamidase
LNGILEHRRVLRVVIAGLATDYCVKESALDAVQLGYETIVIRAAVRAVDLQPGDGDRAFAAMAAAGVAIV